MSNKPTAYRLNIYLSLATICVTAVYIFIVYRYNRELLNNNINQNAINLSSEVQQNVRNNIFTTQEITSNISTQIGFYANNRSMSQLLLGIIERYQSIESIHVELNDSIFSEVNTFYAIYGENGNYSERALPPNLPESHVFQNTGKYFENYETGWTEPYLYQPDNKIVASYCTPVVIDQQGTKIYGGNISVELSLAYLDEAINEVAIGDNGYAFLVTGVGTYLTYPDTTYILINNLEQLAAETSSGDKESLLKILESKNTGFSIGYPDYIDGRKSLVYYSPFYENDWVLFLVLPYSELYKDLNILLFRMIVISLFGLLILFSLFHIISYRLMDPLKNITQKIHEFTSGTISEPIGNEAHTLSRSLDKLQALYIKNELKQKQIIQKDRKTKHDLEQASQIQLSIIPDEFPAFPDNKEIDIYSVYKPAYSISGDLYDYFFIDKNHLLVTIGDVSGKGIPAAFFMGVAHTLLRNKSSQNFSTSNIVFEVNNELCKKNQNQFFLTLFIGILNIKTGLLNYCNAAHTATIILKEDGSIIELEQSHGLPLGLYPDKAYGDSKIVLSPNDTVILYTDGIVDLLDQDKEHFGEKRLRNNLKHLKRESPENIVNRLKKSLDIFHGNEPQNDDISMVVLKYSGKIK